MEFISWGELLKGIGMIIVILGFVLGIIMAAAALYKLGGNDRIALEKRANLFDQIEEHRRGEEKEAAQLRKRLMDIRVRFF